MVAHPSRRVTPARFWLTFKQALELGGNVRKGEHGELVVYADRITRTETDEKGEETEREIPFMKGYTVFNAEQCEDLPAHFTATAEAPALPPIAAASKPPTGSLPRPAPTSATAAPAPITPKARTMCRCRPSRPSAMPRATPRRSRMSSPTGPSMTSAWRATWAACAMATKAMRARSWSPSSVPLSSRADLGITPEVREDHAAYIASWLQVLKNDKRLIFTAAAHAQRAADYLHSLQPQQIEEQRAAA